MAAVGPCVSQQFKCGGSRGVQDPDHPRRLLTATDLTPTKRSRDHTVPGSLLLTWRISGERHRRPTPPASTPSTSAPREEARQEVEEVLGVRRAAGVEVGVAGEEGGEEVEEVL